MHNQALASEFLLFPRKFFQSAHDKRWRRREWEFCYMPFPLRADEHVPGYCTVSGHQNSKAPKSFGSGLVCELTHPSHQTTDEMQRVDLFHYLINGKVSRHCQAAVTHKMGTVAPLGSGQSWWVTDCCSIPRALMHMQFITMLCFCISFEFFDLSVSQQESQGCLCKMPLNVLVAFILCLKRETG